MRSKNSFYWVLFSFLFLTSIVIFNHKYGEKVYNTYYSYNPDMKPQLLPSHAIPYFTLGYKDIYGYLVWIRILQNLDFCENEEKVCPNSWVYHMFDVGTELIKNTPSLFSMGGLTLSILIGDVEGAKHIFDKGVERFPNHWPLLFQTAYHYMESLDKPKEAAKLLIRAADNGAPEWTYKLAARLLTKKGQSILKLSTLSIYSKKLKNPKYIEKINKKIERERLELLKYQTPENRKKILERHEKNKIKN